MYLFWQTIGDHLILPAKLSPWPTYIRGWLAFLLLSDTRISGFYSYRRLL